LSYIKHWDVFLLHTNKFSQPLDNNQGFCQTWRSTVRR